MTSIVASSRAPETERVRDERWDELYDDKNSTILLKSRVSAGDQEKITELTYQAVLKASEANPNIQQMETKFALHRASLATSAVMIVGFEGNLFKDPDSGATLQISGSLEARLDVVRRLPQDIVNFIDRKVAELSANPTQRDQPEKPTKDDSGEASTPA